MSNLLESYDIEGNRVLTMTIVGPEAFRTTSFFLFHRSFGRLTVELLLAKCNGQDRFTRLVEALTDIVLPNSIYVDFRTVLNADYKSAENLSYRLFMKFIVHPGSELVSLSAFRALLDW